MNSKIILSVAALTVSGACVQAEFPLAGADEQTPSKAQYFSWINNTNEGATEAQTLANLAFFKWLRDEYGMQLDLYAWDAGNLDSSGKRYGTFESPRFRENYPHGWKPIADAAADLGCKLGIWGGPDGFGDTPEQAKARHALMVSLCRDYQMALFKFDGVCGTLRPEKQDEFVAMMEECRKFSPELILLNHRLELGKGLPYATTFLWGGEETYIDVHMTNQQTATHHRVQALSRGLPPKMTRLTEDHGVCISSCLDAWDDDLILQAFNRSLILAPEIYGNPWLLRDDEYPKLARIYNLHRRYGKLMASGLVLPKSYGSNAVARGDGTTRFVTLRNLSWLPVTYQIKLGEEIGLSVSGDVEVRRLHPRERVLGKFKAGETLPVEVEPFRACLLMVSGAAIGEAGVEGADAEIIRDLPNKPLAMKLLGLPGETLTVTLHSGTRKFSSAKLDGAAAQQFVNGAPLTVTFPGQKLTQPWHRKLAELQPCAVPADAEALYEATCFAADSDALELRELRRSGPTKIPAVQLARDEFFHQKLFISRGCDSRVLFDGDEKTVLAVERDSYRSLGGRKDNNPAEPGENAQLRVDFAAPLTMDQIVITLAGGTVSGSAEISADLQKWTSVPLTVEKDRVTVSVPAGQKVRYLRLPRGDMKPSEVNAFFRNQQLPREKWRASNMFSAYAPATAAWSGTVTVSEAAPNSYLCIALDGEHGKNGAWVAAKLNGKLLGCPDRAPSFASNTFEVPVAMRDKNNTFYLPLTPDLLNQPLEITALTLGGGKNDYQPSVWITTLNPFVSRDVELK